MTPSLLLRVLEDVYGRVDALGVTPVVAGVLAVAYWGHPRSTQDIDLAVVVSDNSNFEAGLRQLQLTPAKSGRVVDLGFVRQHSNTIDAKVVLLSCWRTLRP